MEKKVTGGYSWADLNSELLVSIATTVDGPTLRDYRHLRSVCTAWRSALPPPYPWCLLYLADNRATRYRRSRRRSTAAATSTPTIVLPVSSAQGTAAFPLPLRRSFQFGNDHTSSIFSIGLRRRIQLKTNTSSTQVRSRSRVVGSGGNGRFAVAIDHANKRYFHRAAEGGIRFSFWTARILLVCPRSGEEVALVPPPMKGFECVHKIVFAPDPDDGTVVAICDGMKIAYIDTSSSASGDDGMSWTAVEVGHLVDLVFDDGGGKVYCLNSYGGVRAIPIPRGGGRNKQGELAAAVADEPSQTRLSVAGATAFPPPYDVVSTLTSTKHLFLCHGSLYQMWQNTSITVNLSNGLTMSADEIFVLKLKLDPGHSPYWSVVKDLQGCSVFIGNNCNPTVVRPAAVPGVRPDCVYWIDWRGDPMVCDVATGTSKPYVDLPYGAITGRPCWYFEDANMTS